MFIVVYLFIYVVPIINTKKKLKLNKKKYESNFNLSFKKQNAQFLNLHITKFSRTISLGLVLIFFVVVVVD